MKPLLIAMLALSGCGRPEAPPVDLAKGTTVEVMSIDDPTLKKGDLVWLDKECVRVLEPEFESPQGIHGATVIRCTAEEEQRLSTSKPEPRVTFTPITPCSEAGATCTFDPPTECGVAGYKRFPARSDGMCHGEDAKERDGSGREPDYWLAKPAEPEVRR